MSTKRGRGVVLQGREREIIYNVYKAFESEKVHANELLRKLSNISPTTIQDTHNGIPISQELFDEITEFLKASMKVNERVTNATGVTKNTVTRIKQEGTAAEAAGTYVISTPIKKPRGKVVVLDDKELYALGEIVTNLYKEDNNVPSVTKILARARSELNFQGGHTTMRKILSEQLRYKFTRGPDQSKQITFFKPNIKDNSEEDIATDYLETEILEIDTENETVDTSKELEENSECSNLPQTEM